MTFEELQKANATIKTMDIKGKEYAEVNQRIKAFRQLYPNGAITADLLSDENGVCTVKATVYDEDGKVLGVGHAQEKETSSYINKTSYIENCETSAVGRALGMVGIGIDTSVASYEEVSNAINNQVTHTCADCHQKIVGVKKNGELWEADKIVSYTKRKFGRELCATCYNAALKAEKE